MFKYLIIFIIILLVSCGKKSNIVEPDQSQNEYIVRYHVEMDDFQCIILWKDVNGLENLYGGDNCNDFDETLTLIKDSNEVYLKSAEPWGTSIITIYVDSEVLLKDTIGINNFSTEIKGVAGNSIEINKLIYNDTTGGYSYSRSHVLWPE